jgi:DNA repair protein RecO (recombination protein O)
MEYDRTEGIVMQVLPFQEKDAIFTVYTPDLGIVKFFLKYAYSSQKKGALPSPLTLAELIYRKSSSDLLNCKEASILESFPKLREKLSCMEAGGNLLQALRQSQPPGKPSPPLYQLLVTYLGKLTQVDDPRILAASFKLKILRYEGVLAFSNRCGVCHQLLKNLFFYDGEFFCLDDAPEGAIEFEVEEGQMLFVMGLTQSFSDLKHLLLTTKLEGKVDRVFHRFALS